MFIHLQEQTRAYVGQTLRTVICEQCGCSFMYLMVRRGMATGTTVYGLGEGRIDRSASTILKGKLEKDVDPVECPDCGWFQRDMLPEIRKRHWPWTPWGSGPKIDPNQGYPMQRGHLPGMPQPIRVAPGSRPREQTGRRMPPALEPGEIVTIQPMADPVPSICIECLSPADTFFTIESSSKGVPSIGLPACKQCATLANKRKLKVLLGCVVVIPAITGIAGACVWTRLPEFRNDMFGYLMQGAFAGGICGLLLGAFVYSTAKSYLPCAALIAGYDFVRHTYRLKFRQSKFTVVLRDLVAQEPLIAPEEDANT